MKVLRSNKSSAVWPGAGPIKNLQSKFYSTLFFKHFDWLLIIFNESKWLKNLLSVKFTMETFYRPHPDWMTFESFWHQICLQKWPKMIDDFLGYFEKRLNWDINWCGYYLGILETFGLLLCSNIRSPWRRPGRASANSLFQSSSSSTKNLEQTQILEFDLWAVLGGLRAGSDGP